MENNLNNQKPVEFFSAERIKIEIDGQQILWRDMNLEIDSKIGEHTIGKIKYTASPNQLSLYDALIDKKGDKTIVVTGRSNISDEAGNATDKIFLNGAISKLRILGKQTDYFVDPIPHEKIKGAVIEARTVHIARTDESKSNLMEGLMEVQIILKEEQLE